MSRFARGIKSGVQVKQGDVIGYVGSTGLATGPHVCFRFWKNGRQVDHLRMNFPPPKPMSEEDIPSFMEERDNLDDILSTIRFHQFESEENKTQLGSVSS
jgi:murein DD-endopeptidase MepM/ murein hydrolase activator NlpD